MEAPSPTSADRLERVEAKLDRLLADNTDEQVAGILGTIRRTLDAAWVQRAIQAGVVLTGVWIMSKMGVINGDQQAALTKGLTGGTAPANESALPSGE